MGWAIAGGVLGLVIMFLVWSWLRNWATAHAGGSIDARIGSRPRRLAGVPEEANPEVKAAPAMEVMSMPERARPGANPGGPQSATVQTAVRSEAAMPAAADAVVEQAAMPAAPSEPATSPMAEAGLVVVEIVAFDQGGDEVGESVLIANRGDAPINVTGWRLADRGDIHAFVFPEMTLEPGAELRIHMWEGEDSSREVYVGGRVRWWNNTGDVVHLYDTTGALRHHFVIEPEQ